MRNSAGFWLLVIAACQAPAVAAPPAAEPQHEEAAPQPAFEQTEPPNWTNETYAPPDPSAEDADPVMQKIRQTGEYLDAEPEAAGHEAVRAEPARQRSLFYQSLKAVWGLLVTLALLCLLVFLLKRYGRSVPILAGANFGKVIGKVYLAPRTHLHFVQIADKVLVVGVTPNAISLLAEFDAEAFEAESEAAAPSEAAPAGALAPERQGFLDYLRSGVRGPAGSPPAHERDDAEIAALRQDIQRLQHYLQEGPDGERD